MPPYGMGEKSLTYLLPMYDVKKWLVGTLFLTYLAVVGFGSNKYVRICATAYLLIVISILAFLVIRYLFGGKRTPGEKQPQEERPNDPVRSRTGSRRRQPEPRCTTPPYEMREKSPVELPTGRPLEGKSFSLSGSMAFKRDNMIALITYFGGEYHRTPRRGTDYLVTTEEDTDKVIQAERNGVAILSPAELFGLMGTDADTLREAMRSGEFIRTLGIAMKPERERRELHSYQRLAEGYTRELREALWDLGEITLPHPVQVVTRDGDGALEVYQVTRMRRTSRGEAILLAMDGEAVYLQDLIEHSIVELRNALSI